MNSDTQSASTLSTQSAVKTPASGTREEPRLYDVEIGGTSLRLRSSHDEKTVVELVQLVNRKLTEAMPAIKSGSPQNASILASLNMAEEFLTWKKKAQAELDELRRQAQALLSELESTRLPVGARTGAPNADTQLGLNN